MGTIGVEATLGFRDRLAAARPGVTFVDAPVSGSKGPAEQGQLLVLASGPDTAASPLRPVFDAIGRKTVWLGQVGQGSIVKLVVNAYLSILIEGVAETMALADRLGISHQQLADVIEGGPLDAPLADAKLHKIDRGDYAPEFPLEWALKDVDLAISAAGGQAPPLLAALSGQWHAAVAAGHGRQDISAARLALPGPEPRQLARPPAPASWAWRLTWRRSSRAARRSRPGRAGRRPRGGPGRLLPCRSADATSASGGAIR
jgi:3-hydroxyisobutyrate dehydrogenase